MSEMERKQKKKAFSVAYVALIVVAALVFALTIMKGWSANIFVGVVIAVLVIFWLMVDVVEPRVLGDLAELTDVQRSAYYKYIALGALGYAGLGYCVINIGGTSSTGIWGAVVYVLTLSARNKFRDVYRGITPEVQDEAESEEEQ